MTNDLINNEKLDLIVTELFIRDRKLYFNVPKDVKLNSTHSFIKKIPQKRELQPIALNYSSYIGFYED